MVLTMDSLSYPGSTGRDRERHGKTFGAVVNYYIRPDLEDKLKKAGFEVIHSRYYLNFSVSHLIYAWAHAPDKEKLCELDAINPRLSVMHYRGQAIRHDRGGFGLAAKARIPESPSPQ